MRRSVVFVPLHSWLSLWNSTFLQLKFLYLSIPSLSILEINYDFPDRGRLHLSLSSRRLLTAREMTAVHCDSITFGMPRVRAFVFA